MDRHSAKHTHTYRQSDIMKKKEREKEYFVKFSNQRSNLKIRNKNKT
jgi:hypothetical protein